MSYLETAIESLIFCSSKPLKIEEIIKVFDEVKNNNVKHDKLKIKRILSTIIEKYKKDNSPFEVVESGGGYQFLTKESFSDLNEILLKQRSKRRLSSSSLETLSIIAYKQPVTKSEIEEIRGVNCDYTIQKLLDKDLISINGKSERIGRPLIYVTSEKFMDYFGINNLDQLPTIKDFREEENSIGNNEDA
ncbi:MAG: SMC-Scp complex subunit ScpB [Amoebophilaceae bacterium TMED152]|nr:MAG: SMC-Scp complex subunit ScpB [Amoebophilaceae bacterium TMED152]